jgi:spermidine synthase
MDGTTRQFRYAGRVLSLSMLVMGACGMIYEYTLGVLGNHLIGGSHEQLFVVIGVMMFAMGVGAALQRVVTTRLLDVFVGIEILLGFVGGMATLAVYASFVWTTSFQVVLLGFAFLVGCLIGLEIPVAVRVNSEYHRSLRMNLSAILSMDYVGSLLGALLFAYVLLTRVSIPRIGVSLGIVNIFLSLVVLAYFWPLVRYPRALLVASLLSLFVLGVSFAKTDGWMVELEQRCFADPIVHSQTTSYQHIVLTERGDHLQLFINGQLQFSSRDEAIYHELLVHVPMTLAESRRRVLVLGGGDGLALREVLRYPDVESVTLVDIDPAITRLASTHPALVVLNEGAFHDARVVTQVPGGVLPGREMGVERPSKLAAKLLDDRTYELARVRVLNVDADLFLQETSGQYDVVLLDFPDPRVVELAKLFSVDFYRTLSWRLAPGGVIALQATSPYHTSKAFLSIGKSLGVAGFRALPYHDNVPSFGEWGWYLAWREGADVKEMEERLARVEELSVATSYLTADVLRGAFRFGRGWLKDAVSVEANTKMRPVLVRYLRESWR